jgi:DNA-binding LacI/PurR family transcriptional regulator
MVVGMPAVRRSSPRIIDLANQIEADIHRRRLRPGDAYLTTAEAARMLRTSGTTANQALQMLVKRGVIERKQRRGAVIARSRQPAERPPLNRVHLLVHRDYLSTEGIFRDGTLLGLQGALPGAQIEWDLAAEIDDPAYINGLVSAALRSDAAEGFVLVRSSLTTQRVIAASGLPAVVFGSIYPSVTGLSRVDRDHAEDGRLLADFLLSRGCRKLAVVMRQFVLSGELDTLEGVRQRALAAGLGLDAFTVRCLPSDEEVAQAALRNLLAGMLGLPAVQASSNGQKISKRGGHGRLRKWPKLGLVCRTVLLADAAAQAARSLGLTVPKDVEIAVCNYYAVPGDTPRYPYAALRLTAEQQGARLGGLLARQAAGELLHSEHEIIPVTLEVPPGL